MSAGRRGLLLSVAFFGCVLWLCPTNRARAQQPLRPVPGGNPHQLQMVPENDPHAGRHTIWQRDLRAEQIRDLLAKFGKGDADANKQLEDLIRDSVKQRNPRANDDQVDAAIKRMLADKEFMKRMTDLAQKHKNENPNQNPNEMPRLTPEDIEKLKNLRPNDNNGADPFKLPKIDPNTINPNDPPRVDPNTGRPIAPNQGLPKIAQAPPPNMGGPPVPPPMIDPKTGQPTAPPNPDERQPFDPENPFGNRPDSPEKTAKTKTVETATALWEKNVGPIDESPAVKRALLDLVNDPDAMNALTDSKGNSLFDMFKEGGDGEGMKDLFGGGEGQGWEWPKLDLDFNWSRSERNFNVPESSNRSRWPDMSMPDRARGGSGSSMGGMGSFDFGGVQVPWLIMLILFALVLTAVLWWKWAAIFPASDRAVRSPDGLGAWPLDPRSINTREDVVKAFEYLSVLICGPGAKTWTHSTIADELTQLAQTHGETAVKLARLYELARYAPLDEPLTRAEVLEARRLVCDLAGVDEA
ncbi:unnamed protein product [Gemmata massiliana]|uniref:DUF4129 domain-containing protein n=1 Tax=Gemmata massiliana TaxID=1210884 RepID=A0A6P2D1V5_9BACT|nr:hypothetical protein [Gemmata massiliana]VTR94375.1 unnamed protein product [Gemmata massiliana]